MDNRTVSAIIIAYNDERFIARAIESAIDQTYSNLEIIVVDDGSDDRTLEIAQSYSDRGVRVVGKQNGGAASARNLGVKHSTGRYLAFLDSDDIWVPEKIEKMVNACARVEEPCLVYSGFYFVNEKVRPVMRPFRATTTSPYHELLRCRNQMLPSTMLVSREVFDALEGFPEDEQVRGHEDAVFSLLATRGFTSVPVPEPLTIYYYSSSGYGRAPVYDYDHNVYLQLGVQKCVKPFLSEDEFHLFTTATWINNFCKFCMHGQLRSARRLKKEMNIPAGQLLRSVRGVLAFVSAYSGLNLLYLSKGLYQKWYTITHKALNI